VGPPLFFLLLVFYPSVPPPVVPSALGFTVSSLPLSNAVFCIWSGPLQSDALPVPCVSRFCFFLEILSPFQAQSTLCFFSFSHLLTFRGVVFEQMKLNGSVSDFHSKMYTLVFCGTLFQTPRYLPSQTFFSLPFFPRQNPFVTPLFLVTKKSLALCHPPPHCFFRSSVFSPTHFGNPTVFQGESGVPLLFSPPVRRSLLFMKPLFSGFFPALRISPLR